MSEAQTAGFVLTIGHSNRSLEEFLRLLESNGVTLLVDVRTRPRSRHNPQFDLETLPASLAARGIGYRHAPALGGLRRSAPDSPNDGWADPARRGFADYMRTEGFVLALEDLIARLGGARVALMCAEADPANCHRSLIADALAARRCDVRHIVAEDAPHPHRITPWARVAGGRVEYPAVAPRLPGIP